MNYDELLAKYDAAIIAHENSGRYVKTDYRKRVCMALELLVIHASQEARLLFDKHCESMGSEIYAHLIDTKINRHAVQLSKRGHGYTGVVLVEYFSRVCFRVFDIFPNFDDPTKVRVKVKKTEVEVPLKDLTGWLKDQYLDRWIDSIMLFGLITPPPKSV